MYKFTVYQHKTRDTVRVVFGDHAAQSDIENYSVRVYLGSDRQIAIDTAYAGENDINIRAQIARFGVSLEGIELAHAPTRCAYNDCKKVIPSKYGKPGVALSRHDNKTLICSMCGNREALIGLPASLMSKRHA